MSAIEENLCSSCCIATRLARAERVLSTFSGSSASHDTNNTDEACMNLELDNTQDEAGSVDNSLPCRARETMRIREFIDTILCDKKNKAKNSKLSNESRSMYICGSPGTGKTSVVRQILRERLMMQTNTSFQDTRVLMLNGMAFRDAKHLITHIVNELCLSYSSKEDPLEILRAVMTKKNTLPCLVVIDELDALLPKKSMNVQRNVRNEQANSQEHPTNSLPALLPHELDSIMANATAHGSPRPNIHRSLRKSITKTPPSAKRALYKPRVSASTEELLYKLFGVCSASNSKMGLIGIANAINMTDEWLPHLRVYGTQPQIVMFKPYTSIQIVHLLKHRIRAAWQNERDTQTDIPFTDASLQLLAKKVAKSSGDLRRAIEICSQCFRHARHTFQMNQSKNHTDKNQQVSISDMTKCSEPSSKRIRIDGSKSSIVEQEEDPYSCNNLCIRCQQELDDLTTEQTFPSIGIQEMQKEISVSFASPYTTAIAALPRDAIMLLAAILTRSKQSTTGSITLPMARRAFGELCKKHCLQANISPVEFRDLIDRLSEDGIVATRSSKPARRKLCGDASMTLCLNLTLDDLNFALQHNAAWDLVCPSKT